MLYPKSLEKTLLPQLFKNPTSEYRGAPFWAWNCKLDKDQLLGQIGFFKEMGMGGFHIHSRTGMNTEYLGNKFMELVKECNEKAKEEGMLCWLYDEDRYPSGFAGGYVTKDLRYRARHLVFSPVKPEGNILLSKEEFDDAISRKEKPQGYFIARYQVNLKKDWLESYKKLHEGEEAERGTKSWWAYLELQQETSWYNNQTYVNTLDKNAIDKFIEITHEKYFTALRKDFGSSIPAIFTDEPKFGVKEFFRIAGEEGKLKIPYTDDFHISYEKTYGEDILDFLPEIFWELPQGDVSRARYQYHCHLTERFANAYADNLGAWCEKHGIMLTGHMYGEESLTSQTSTVGEVMRSLRSFQLPGIDVLCDQRDYAIIKQAQSVSHQYGRNGVTSELYGVTNWDFDFKGHKMGGDWQAALGVTVRVHHLAWVSMEGDAKRDYPASIGYQSPWYKEYNLIENYFSRINTALTRGRPHVRIGVIFPVESMWIQWGPYEQTSLLREELEKNYKEVVQLLLSSLLDFDFISESLLPELCPSDTGAPIKVGAMEYDVIIVPGCYTLRGTTVERLESYVNAGGKLIFMGEPAKLIEAKKSDRAECLAKHCISIPFSKFKLNSELEIVREIDICLEDGTRPDNFLYQMRLDGENRWLFISHGFEKKRDSFLNMVKSEDLPYIEKIQITIKGIWKPVLYDTMNGEIYPLPAEIVGNNTCLKYHLSIHDSLLLFLEPGEPEKETEIVSKNEKANIRVELKDHVRVTLSEPNVLVLETAEYSLDGVVWEQEEEILRINRILKDKLSYTFESMSREQPWAKSVPGKTPHTLFLKFTYISDINVNEPSLALENPTHCEIFLNDVTVLSEVTGWYVDKAIKTVKLPPFTVGKNVIILKIPFGPNEKVEWCYLLGDFGVEVRGQFKKIIEPVEKLCFGDWTTQGLPFYAGNVTYQCKFSSKGEVIGLEAKQFSNPLLSVKLDGIDKGKIAFAPYALNLGFIEKGEHLLEITAYGNRFNAFGQLHNCDKECFWYGSNAWGTHGDRWSPQYQLKKMGLLISPKLIMY